MTLNEYFASRENDDTIYTVGTQDGSGWLFFVNGIDNYEKDRDNFDKKCIFKYGKRIEEAERNLKYNLEHLELARSSGVSDKENEKMIKKWSMCVSRNRKKIKTNSELMANFKGIGEHQVVNVCKTPIYGYTAIIVEGRMIGEYWFLEEYEDRL